MNKLQLQQFINEHWGINIKTLHFVRNHDQQIAEVTDEFGHTYLIKGEQQQAHEVEAICQFANTMQQILPTATYLKTKGSMYSTTYNHLVYTLETKLDGDELETLHDAVLKEIATQLAQAHQFSLSKQLRLHKATSWSMFGGNKTTLIGDYDENELSFQEFEKVFHLNPYFPTIKQHYETHRANLKKLWLTLPKAATQGDFCYYNMLFKNNKIVALFDFNLAGDEVLINECVAVGIYLCWHVDYEGNRSNEQRFKLFIETYQKVRPFSELETEAFPQLVAIIRAFRYDRVDQGIENVAFHDEFIQQTKLILENPVDAEKEQV